ncbi:hypothetical protein DEJ28_07985 [Curtobacterium sp. MCPF17_002]|uniref:hypothetical protein n=1 Tax=Curtobacterium sp. MCPF17_002 TaxID=2175645 RepID=UPI000DA9364D|nr:hypothetical protein [Curtobacterium sp. MCPF17_002]WIB79027.1 hypothetical protein DEJ28_07985 [Curtobacterium sp. MCPF17_002]
MSEMSTAEYAAKHGISQRRVQAAAVAGSIPARRVGGRWLVIESSVSRRRPGRPLSPRSVRAVECVLSGAHDWDAGLSRSERARAQRRLAELRADPVPWSTVAYWTRAEYREPVCYRAADADLEDLRDDGRLVPSGVSDHRSGLSDAGFLEGHVAGTDLDALEAEFLLVRTDDRPNVLLHVDDARSGGPVPLGRLIIELAHHDGARERTAVSELVRRAG